MRFSVGVALVFLAGLACAPSASRVVVELDAPLGTSTDIMVTADNGSTLHKTQQGVPRSIGITPTKGATVVTVKVTVTGVDKPCSVPSVTREVTFDLSKLGEHASIALQITCENGNPGTGGNGQGMGGQGTGGQASGGQGAGGQGTGGSATGGTGDQGAGGQSTGGQATGGAETGGAGTGGQATGGQGGHLEGGQGGGASSHAGAGGTGAAVGGNGGYTSTGGAGADCPPDAGSIEAGGSGAMAGTCEAYCLQYALACSGQASSNASQAPCTETCSAAKLPAGTVADTSGNSLGCRIFWLTLNVRPDICSMATIPSSALCLDK